MRLPPQLLSPIKNTMLVSIIVLLLAFITLPKCDPPPPSPSRINKRLRQSTVTLDGSFTVYGLLVNDHYSWSGSGVIISLDQDHYTILSNAHVVGTDGISGAKMFINPTILTYTLEVTMPDDQKAPASAVFVNSNLKDFALVYVNASVGNYPPLRLTRKHSDVGAQVFAMGEPLGLPRTFANGIVSAYRSFPTPLGLEYEVVQHTVPISHGSSGGPLVDDYCNLIGINTLNITDGSAQNLNFAITGETIARSEKEWIRFPLNPADIGAFVVNLMKGRYKQ